MYLGFLLVFDAGEDSPGSSAPTDGILVGHTQEVSLLDGELLVHLHHALDVVHHVLEALGLLGELGHVDEFLA